MSRSTQFIGLTTRGEEFISELEQVPSNKHTCGMFEEKIPLRRWKAPERRWHKAKFIQEVVQEIAWSSGPMIFTRLEIEYYQSDGQMCTAPCFEWVHDPRVEAEFDYDLGIFWI